MDHCENVIEKPGARSVRISLPCFSSDADSRACTRMNSFYSHAADEIYEYALSLVESAEGRARFACTYEAEMSESDATVTLHLSYSRIGTRTMRKSVTHRWRGGHVVGKSIG